MKPWQLVDWQGSFHEVLASFEVGYCSSGSGFSFGSIQHGLIPVPVDRSTALGAAAQGSKITEQRGSFGSDILPGAAILG
jgi:hypothetical protein